MKNIVLAAALVLFATGASAQNRNVTSTSTSTVTTVKDSEGEKTLVKTQRVNETQNVELQNAESNALNKDVKPSPVQVTASTTITAPDGTTRVVDVDRSAYYSLGGKRYQVSVDNTGYTMMTDNNQKAGVLRPLSNNTYIYRNGDRTSVGSFDADGNLILQSYDDKTDKVTTEMFTRNQ
ncbi:MAG TPA: hypothetical protein VF676_00470 [Flavobacterium sp.]|jgi:hypothetical protein